MVSPVAGFTASIDMILPKTGFYSGTKSRNLAGIGEQGSQSSAQLKLSPTLQNAAQDSGTGASPCSFFWCPSFSTASMFPGTANQQPRQSPIPLDTPLALRFDSLFPSGFS